MVPVGFEPTHLSILGLKSNALDHSAKVPTAFKISMLFNMKAFLINLNAYVYYGKHKK